MLKTGKDYLEGLRDGRVVYIGNERVEDVTTHPAFRNIAQTMAAIYDMKADPSNRDLFAYEEDGSWHSLYYMRPTSRDDLRRRTKAHKAIADASFGLFGRSPDYVASFVVGMASRAEVFGERADTVVKFWKFMRDNDVFASHAVVSPHAARDPSFYNMRNQPAPTLRVIREEDDGVVVSGMKMLATGGPISDECWVGNILPLAPEAKAESVTFSVPIASKGVSLWSRRPFEPYVDSEVDSPLSYRFDETDAMIVFDEVKVPWERVFVHNDTELSRALYITTPSHSYGNHQSNVRFLSKLQMILGLASRVTQATGADKVPQVRETLGGLATQEAMLKAMIDGQIEAAEDWGPYKGYNRRSMYAAMNWCADTYSSIIDTLRELCGGGALQMPADISFLKDAELTRTFRHLWDSPHMEATQRLKLFKLAWDIVGSEFAGRHLQYERFFGGPRFVQRNHSFREAPWAQFNGIVDGLMDRCALPGEAVKPAAAAE